MKEYPLAMAYNANKSQTEFYIMLQVVTLIYLPPTQSITRNSFKCGCHLKKRQVEKNIAL